jgi:protocatechuate 3,4-dioxygenase beta subunit
MFVRVEKAGFVTDRLTIMPKDARGEVLHVPLSRAASIAGRVTDASGEPLQDVQVTAARVNPSVNDGGRFPDRIAAVTNDLGEYRFGGLPAGRYRISIFSNERDSLPTIEIRPGDELGSIDFIDPNPVRAAAGFPEGLRQLARGGATITGSVLSDKKKPLSGARVRAMSPGASIGTAVTDKQGRYAIEGMSAASYTIDAGKAGYPIWQYGQTRAFEPGLQVVVHSNEIVRDVDIVLSRGSAVSGTITDERGEPIQGVNVRALQMRYGNGRTMALNAPGVRERFTDDRGRYRLFGFAPGAYLIVASVDATISNATTRGYAPIFYPGSTQVTDAVPLHVDVGRDASADLVFHQVPAARVTGTVLDTSNEPIAASLVLVASARSGAIALEPQNNLASQEDGSFAIPNVPAGDYVLQAFKGARDGPEFGATLVTVGDGDPKPVVIHTAKGSTLEGQLVVEGDGAKGIPLHLMPIPADFDYAPVVGRFAVASSYRADGTFTQRGLFGPTRFLYGGGPEWYLKSINIGGVDVTDVPFDFGITNQTINGAEVVISNAGGTIAGHVTDARSMPITNYSVIVFATDRTKWFSNSRFLKFGRPAQDGGFEIAGLPPGEYWVAAVDTIQGTAGNGEWEKPEVLEVLATRATRVMLAERERVLTVLRLIRR